MLEDEIGTVPSTRPEEDELSDIWAEDSDSVLGGESLYCTEQDEIARGYMIKRNKEHLVNKIIINELSLAALDNDKHKTAQTAQVFVSKFREAEESMIKQRVKKFIESEDFESESEKADKAPFLRLPSEIESDFKDYSSLQDKFEADAKVREKEGLGVRLPVSNMSDYTEGKALMGKHKKLETVKEEPNFENQTAASEPVGKKTQEGVIEYPTACELEDKHNYMFY